MNRNNFLFYALLTIAVVACKNSSSSNEESPNPSNGLIEISKHQFESGKMEIGTIGIHCFEDEVVCNGCISSSPNGMAKISTPISGVIEKIFCNSGDYVKIGQILCQLSSKELISLQQEFSETSSKLVALKSDYERTKALYQEQIGAKKDFISAESKYISMNAKYQSLKLQLQILKLNVEQIEKGNFYAALPLRSPINGYITNHKLMLGQFIEQQEQLIEVVDPNQLQIRIDVFEKDVTKLKKGQKILFNSLGDPDSIYNAELSSVGKEINADSKTVHCFAKIKDLGKTKLINGSYIEARIIVDQKDANALPSNAILKSGNDRYIFIVQNSDTQNYFLRKQKINIGNESRGYTEILESNDLSQVLIKGAYNIPLE